MNIQIFGTKKSSDTRKAERFFKKRGIKFQFVDLKVKAMSKSQRNSDSAAAGVTCGRFFLRQISGFVPPTQLERNYI
jgi:arsenate reductase-like glutaredoxin family protein